MEAYVKELKVPFDIYFLCSFTKQIHQKQSIAKQILLVSMASDMLQIRGKRKEMLIMTKKLATHRHAIDFNPLQHRGVDVPRELLSEMDAEPYCSSR